jgi:hypothetical protein
MLRQALIVLCIALAVQAKTRKGPLPHLFWDQVKHLDVVDEPEEKIVGGEEVILIKYSISDENFNTWQKIHKVFFL